jgi:hypothetical protein
VLQHRFRKYYNFFTTAPPLIHIYFVFTYHRHFVTFLPTASFNKRFSVSLSHIIFQAFNLLYVQGGGEECHFALLLYTWPTAVIFSAVASFLHQRLISSVLNILSDRWLAVCISTETHTAYVSSPVCSPQSGRHLCLIAAHGTQSIPRMSSVFFKIDNLLNCLKTQGELRFDFTQQTHSYSHSSLPSNTTAKFVACKQRHDTGFRD